ncbi:hypothetical protein [Polyangium sorediatum]|uniref:Uncharacterized protein n=1 Tax=Polyangium sorediatum TaxID=889274 RepID=A0ABT6NLP2_9BACT|nr:hypothetical protein [Polyangium sorediatum]MDI1429213.1 hypothetical protein [Polyangium sorediatum]
MSRTFTPVDLVQLPRVDSNGAIALASAVESAASKYNDLPASVTEAVIQIVADRIVLQQAVAKTPVGLVTVKEADRRVDKVGGAFHDICSAWASLAEFLPEGQDAQVLMARVFPDGRKFVNLKVKEEWAAIETKLSTIDREGLGARIDAIGATPVLKLLEQMQAVYGAVIGTTEVPEEAPEVRDSKDTLLDSLRAYVIQVAGTVKRGKPETAARADALLRPIREWESTKPAKDKADGPEAPAGTASGAIRN